jgi:hypothetical protein
MLKQQREFGKLEHNMLNSFNFSEIDSMQKYMKNVLSLIRLVKQAISTQMFLLRERRESNEI